MTDTKKNKMVKEKIMGKPLLWVIGGIVLLIGIAFLNQKTAVATEVVVYKTPSCGCCKEWVKHLQENGFRVEVHDRNDLTPIKKQLGVPGNLQSCHTAKVGNYVVEGHVPADDNKLLLKEKPNVVGLTVPGMPHGSPGMDMGPRKDPYDVLTFKSGGKTDIFSSYNQR